MDALFRALAENSADAIVMLNADGTVGFASAAMTRLLGYSVDEWLGRSAFEHMHPDDVRNSRDAFDRCVRQPAVPIANECRLRHKNGEWRYVETLSVNRLDDRAVNAIVVTYHDITDRRHAEQALRTSEQRLRHIVDHAQDLIYYCDLQGRFTFVNPAAARVMKYGESELLGRHFLTLIRPDYRERAAELYTRQLTERLPTTYLEFPAVTKERDIVWVGQYVQLAFDGDHVFGVHAIARDISSHKQLEDELRQSHARYWTLIQDAPYGIFRTTVDGRILDVNPALADLLGYESPDEILALNIAELYDSAADYEALPQQYRREHDRTLSTDVTWKKKDGAAIVVHLTGRVAPDNTGAICFEGIVNDVTERRGLEEQLRQAQKMEAVGRLARGVAHDFNNVLAAIIGCSELLALHLKEGDPARDDAEEIRKAAERGAALTKQLLAFSRGQPLMPKVVDLNALVCDIESMLQRVVKDHSTVRVQTADSPVLASVEPGQFEQALTNLVVNAGDAMPNGGDITITVSTLTLDAENTLRFPAIPIGRYARIAIADTGTGIDPATQAHIFEPFFYDEGPAERHGPWPVDRLRHREGGRRHGDVLDEARRRNDVRNAASPRSQFLVLSSQFFERTPGFRILAPQRVEIDADIIDRKLGGNLLHRVGHLRRVGLHILFLNQSVVVRDAKRVEERAHHRPLVREMIENQRARGERIREAAERRKVARLAFDIEADHGLRAEFLLLRDQEGSLHLIVGRFLVAPECERGARPLIQRHLLPHSRGREGFGRHC
jgi:PAS domain S-box-containing protein